MPVDLTRRGAGKRDPARTTKKLALEILRVLDRERHELSVVLVGDREIRRLNAEYRNSDYATDVLSFPVVEKWSGPTALLGDVVISVDRAAAQAKERGRTKIEEMAVLLIHGIVHLLGYDHERSAHEARAMRRVERKVYRALCERKLL